MRDRVVQPLARLQVVPSDESRDRVDVFVGLPDAEACLYLPPLCPPVGATLASPAFGRPETKQGEASLAPTPMGAETTGPLRYRVHGGLYHSLTPSASALASSFRSCGSETVTVVMSASPHPHCTVRRARLPPSCGDRRGMRPGNAMV